jgi:hypothetical protein
MKNVAGLPVRVMVLVADDHPTVAEKEIRTYVAESTALSEPEDPS